MKFHHFSFVFLIVFGIFLSGCNDNDPFSFEPDFSMVPEPFDTTGATLVQKESGLSYYVIEEGTGPFQVTIIDQVALFFTGRRTSGEIFDSSYEGGRSTPINNSVRSFIEGFTEGLIGMKLNERRVLIVPPELGYAGATRNSPNFDLRNDTLIFDIELDEIIDP